MAEAYYRLLPALTFSYHLLSCPLSSHLFNPRQPHCPSVDLAESHPNSALTASLYYYLSPSPIHLTFVTKTDVWRTLASHISSLYCFSFDHNLTPNSTTLRSPSSKRLALLSPAHFSVPVDLIASLWRHYLLPTEKYKATERQRTGFYHSL